MTPEEFARETFRMSYYRAGVRHQMDKTIEECAELIHAIMKSREHGVEYSHAVYEEMAHVDLCLDCIKYHLSTLSGTSGTLLERYEKIKAKRLEDWHEFEAQEELKGRR